MEHLLHRLYGVDAPDRMLYSCTHYGNSGRHRVNLLQNDLDCGGWGVKLHPISNKSISVHCGSGCGNTP